MAPAMSSCLKILTCAGSDAGDLAANASADAVDNAGSQEECKGLSEKSRWSFRRRSTRHRVLKNSEASQPGGDKGNTDSHIDNLHYVIHACNQENSSIKHAFSPTFDSEQPVAQKHLSKQAAVLSEHLNSEDKSSVVSEEINTTVEQNFDAVATVIQAGIRSFMAQIDLSKKKRLVRLQAVIRGHLVRMQATQTLRCLLAIIKMQELVRVHQAQRGVDKLSTHEGQVYQVTQCSPEISTVLVARIFLNRFAKKIFISGPASKEIHIRCVPSRSDGTWKWLERWTTILPVDVGVHAVQHIGVNKSESEKLENEVEDEPKAIYSSCHLPSCVPVSNDQEENTYNFSCTSAEVDRETKLWATNDPTTSSEPTVNLKSVAENVSSSVSEEGPVISEADREFTFTSEHPNSYNGGLRNAAKCEPLEINGRKIAPRKLCNPAFAAAQLKFEELSSNSVASRSISSSHHDTSSKAKFGSFHLLDSASSKDNGGGSFVARGPRNLRAASECGTEISISSTLDSPDRSEAETGEIILEIGAFEGAYGHNADSDSKIEHQISFSEDVHQPRQNMIDNEEFFDSVAASGNTKDDEQLNEKPAKSIASVDEVHLEQPVVPTKSQWPDLIDKETGPPVRQSLEGTPRSEITITGSYETPSSDVSVNVKKSKQETLLPNQNAKNSALAKRSLSSPITGSRRSTDDLLKETKNSKTENIVGDCEADTANQAPRISNSNALPSYMQYTESARAKTSISPKLSPNVHDSQLKKRHSLPITNARQDSSPRIQRSTSQPQQISKANGAPPNNSERKWQI